MATAIPFAFYYWIGNPGDTPGAPAWNGVKLVSAEPAHFSVVNGELRQHFVLEEDLGEEFVLIKADLVDSVVQHLVDYLVEFYKVPNNIVLPQVISGTTISSDNATGSSATNASAG